MFELGIREITPLICENSLKKSINYDKINQSKMTVKEGEMVFIPKNTWHKITAIGDKPAVRLAVSRADVEHVYKNKK